MYGLQVSLVRDTHYAGAYGADNTREVPAIHMEAMALDNLLTLGTSVRRDASVSGIPAALASTGLALICCLVCVAKRSVFAIMRVPRILNGKASDVVAFGLTSVSVSYILFWYAALSPVNWVGALIASGPVLLAEAALKRKELEDYLNTGKKLI